ncbi:MAG: T9SS type A sorting domain-containing protein [Rhodothermales bacterium]|nr:T9SS type A sorting domain-containing protein [Rhodothermales bacterium]MBO6781363.1 T9SS type A sorting domain-containing protein [Rhodothermales bacterium]
MKAAATQMCSKHGWLREGLSTIVSAVLLLAMFGAAPAFGQTAVDLVIGKGNTPDQVAYPGDVTTYTVTLTNSSATVDADDIEITDDLPEDHLGNAIFGVPFNVMNTHGTYSYDAGTNTITVSDIDLAPLATMTLTYDVAVVTPFEGDYTNTAAVTFPPAWIFDPDLSNNTTSYLLTVLEPIKFPAKSAVQALVACQNEADAFHILAGQMNGPILRSVPDGFFLGGRRWSTSTVGLPVENLVVNDLFVVRNPVSGVADQVFAAVWGYDGLYRTDDCGRTWSTVDFPGMAQYGDPFKIVYAITRGPGGPLGYILYASADRGRIFRSLDGGITWDMTMSLPGGSADTPWAIAADPTTEGLLFAGTFGNGLYISRDYGEFWERTGNNGIPGSGAMHIFDLEFDPEKMPMTLWAATAEGVFFTQDEGFSWAEQSDGLEITGNNGVTFVTKEARAIAFAKPNPGSTLLDYSLYTAVWGAGIFKLEGDRYYTNWDPVLLRNFDSNAILVHNGSLIVGTNGQGMYEVPIAASSTSTEGVTAEIPEGFNLQQNYPNPFNPTTSISFDLPEAAAVRLSVFDVLGREVAVLVDGKMNAGNHAVSFDAAGFQSGMYIYRLETAAHTLTKSMVLMK